MEKKSRDLDQELMASGSNKKMKYFKSFPQQLPNRSCCFVYVHLLKRKGQILRSTPNTAPLICGAYNTQPEGLLTTA